MTDSMNEIEEFTITEDITDIETIQNTEQNSEKELTAEEKALIEMLSSAIDDVTFNYPSIGKRILAYVIDIVFTILIAVPFLFGMIVIEDLQPFNYDVNNSISLIFGLGFFLVPIIYLFGKDGLFKGRSVGRRATGIILLKHDCVSPANIFQSAIRQLPFFGASSVIPMFGGFIEFYFMNTKPLNLRLGDLLSRTATFNYTDYLQFQSIFNQVDRKQIVPTSTLKLFTKKLFRDNVVFALN